MLVKIWSRQKQTRPSREISGRALMWLSLLCMLCNVHCTAYCLWYVLAMHCFLGCSGSCTHAFECGIELCLILQHILSNSN